MTIPHPQDLPDGVCALPHAHLTATSIVPMRRKQRCGHHTSNTQSRAQKPHVCAENQKNVMFSFAILLRFINLAASITYRKPPMGRGWADIYITKGVTDALVLTIRELRNFNCLSRTKQWGRPIGCIICSPHWLRTLRAFVAGVDTIYLHRRGASGIARFDRQGNAKAYESWNGQQAGSTFCVLYIPHSIFFSAVVARPSS